MTKIKITEILFITRLEQCIVIGELLSGEITKGMFIHEGIVKLKISSIEETDEKIDGKWVSRIGLRIDSSTQPKEQIEKLIGEIVNIDHL